MRVQFMCSLIVLMVPGGMNAGFGRLMANECMCACMRGRHNKTRPQSKGSFSLAAKCAAAQSLSSHLLLVNNTFVATCSGLVPVLPSRLHWQ